MPYLQLNKDNSIKDVESEDSGGGILVSEDEVKEISQNRFGHAAFIYAGGNIVFDSVKYDAIKLEKEKHKYIETLITNEIKIIAKKNLISQIAKVNSMKDIKSLRSLKG